VIRLVLVDDDALVRAGLPAVLGAEDDLVVVGEAEDGVDVTDLVRRTRPDVVLMDVRMPRVGGIDATAHLLAAVDPAPRVLVVTTFGHDEAVLDALRVGAAGFLLKRARPEEIVAAVRTVARGESLLYPDALRTLVGRQRDARPIEGLTARERDVLGLVARGRTNAEIATELVVGVQTVKTHVAAVLAKLGARDRTQAVVLAYETGFVRPGDPA
jgi:DNA-binding NarL/FixJ family response regulator